MNAERLLNRFLKYVQVDTTANPDSDSYPSSDGQLALGKLLVEELIEMGAQHVEQDEHGLVYATIPSNVDRDVPTVALNSHVDTSPETTGANVQPQVIRGYAGGDIVLPGDNTKVIRVAENPELDKLHGCTLVTTDGTTLLGGDDKGGIAVIMELAEHLLENSRVPHGEIRVLFTCDEEIGLGVQHVDLDRLAADVCYTLDGGGANTIDTETFSADQASITVRGVNIHPSIAKDRMVNAIRAVGDLLTRLPATLSPEQTMDRDGFVHPYVIEGGVAEVVLRVLLRDFDTGKLREQESLLRRVAEETAEAHPGTTIDVEVQKQYRNMAEGLLKEPRAVDFAVEAHRRLGRPPELTIVRGGTDGSQFTERGLPTPNLATGQHNPHSPLEWACLDEMVQAVDVLVELVQLWAEADKS